MKTLQEMRTTIESELKHARIETNHPVQGYEGHLYGIGFKIAIRNAPKDNYRSVDNLARIVSVVPSGGSRWGGEPTRTYKLRKDGTFNVKGIVEATRKCHAASVARAELAEFSAKNRKADKEREQVTKKQLADALGLEQMPYRHRLQQGVTVSVDSQGLVKIELENRSVVDALELLEKLKCDPNVPRSGTVSRTA